jgi:hypothetical protein
MVDRKALHQLEGDSSVTKLEVHITETEVVKGMMEQVRVRLRLRVRRYYKK